MPSLSALRAFSAPLPLLLPRYDPKVFSLPFRTLLPRPSSRRRSLLDNLAPPTLALYPRATAAYGRKPRHPAGTGLGDDTLVGELAATDEFLGEAAAVERLRGGINRVGDDIGFRRELEELGDEVIDCLRGGWC